MTPAQREQVLRTLWPEGETAGRSVWAVIDLARDPKAIYLALLESRLEFRCLYEGRVPRDLERVAPHLVELLPANRLVHRWLDEHWGRSWGIFLTVGDPSNLRHHLRKFLRVQGPGGRPLLFRFYDPRVLRTFLPTCTADELRQVFGSVVQRFIAETADGSGAVSYSLQRGELRTSRLPAAMAAPGLELHESNPG